MWSQRKKNKKVNKWGMGMDLFFGEVFGRLTIRG
jgi:hypothetical protein